jgi:dinuclear metal center YbgI/SA1388 family protein
MTIGSIINFLETLAPPELQESYDNAGLIIGSAQHPCTGILISLDVTEQVVEEAEKAGVNLIVAHHPLIFGGLKKIQPNNTVGKAVIRAIKSDIAIFAIHTNLDNILEGVNGKMADMLGLQHYEVLVPKPGTLRKLHTYVPREHLDKVRDALFAAGAGNYGKYDEVAFVADGTGQFRALPGADPFVGVVGKRHYENEARIEVIYPAHIEKEVVAALISAHPYEEVAFDLVALGNLDTKVGSGLVGDLKEEMEEEAVLKLIKEKFKLSAIRHTPFTGRKVKKIALCGGAGSFLISNALRSGAQFFITGDVKYHEFFGAEGRMVIADIGHYESEQFTCDLLFERLQEKFLNFAVLKSGVKTNPVKYFI